MNTNKDLLIYICILFIIFQINFIGYLPSIIIVCYYYGPQQGVLTVAMQGPVTLELAKGRRG